MFEVIPGFAIGFTVLNGVVHLIFAVGVCHDAAKLPDETPPRSPALVGLAGWTIATLIGGPLIAATYWLLNRSTLRPPPV